MRSSGPVLVVDDHVLSRKLLRRVLELEGMAMVEAASVRAARAEIARSRPAVILVDLELPDGDGLALARSLKSDPRTSQCAILACTAGITPHDEQRALDAGCEGYFRKPIDPPAVAAAVARLLARRTEEPRASYSSSR